MRGMDFAELAAFVEIAQQRSFAKAAAKLGVSRPTLSQNMRALEERLGVRLLNRTTRSVAPTEIGERLLTRLRPLFEGFTSVLGEVDSLRAVTAGHLRLSIPPPTRSLIEPMLARFLAAYPAVTLEISVNAVPGDIVSGGFDAGIRLGEYVERDMQAVRLSNSVRPAMVVAPSYLASHPAPGTPRDLQKHNCIRYRLSDGTIRRWSFVKKDKHLEVTVDGSFITDDEGLLLRAVIDGMGIANLPYNMVEGLIRDGTLTQVLEDWTPSLSGYFLYYPSADQMPAALRAFISFVQADIKARNGQRAAGTRPRAQGRRLISQSK